MFLALGVMPLSVAQENIEAGIPSEPQPEQIHLRPATAPITVPSPTIITQPNFKSDAAYGITTDSTGIPFTDHKIYATDSYYFLSKVRDGMNKVGENSELKGLLVELQKAIHQYDGAEGNIHFEEQTRLADRIGLDNGPTPRGVHLREQMKEAIQRMEELRSKISSLFGSYLEAGRLAEEKQAP